MWGSKNDRVPVKLLLSLSLSTVWHTKRRFECDADDAWRWSQSVVHKPDIQTMHFFLSDFIHSPHFKMMMTAFQCPQRKFGMSSTDVFDRRGINMFFFYSVYCNVLKLIAHPSDFLWATVLWRTWVPTEVYISQSPSSTSLNFFESSRLLAAIHKMYTWASYLRSNNIPCFTAAPYSDLLWVFLLV